MIIEVTQDDITLGQANSSGLTRGGTCPITRAVARTLGVPLSHVYTANRYIEVRWVGPHPTRDVGSYSYSNYTLDAKGENFIAQADNADGHGCSGSDSPKPITLVIHQQPLHCPV